MGKHNVEVNSSKKVVRQSILLLTWPAIIEYALQIMVTYVDYIMVGRLGVRASATVGLNTEVNFLVKGVNIAIGIGILVYISGHIGAGDFIKAKKGAMQGLLLAIILGAAEFIVMMAICPVLPGWLGAGNAIKADAVQYFTIIYIPVLFIAVNSIAGSILKAAGDMKTPMYVNLFINIIHIIINFLLIYPSDTYSVFNHPIHIIGAGMGIRGAATATAIVSVIGGIMMFAGVYKNPTISPGRFTYRLDKDIMKKFWLIGIPLIICRAMSSFGRLIFTVLVTGLGTIIFGAHTIAFTAESAFYIPVIGFQTAVTTLAGNTLGRENKKELDIITKETVKMASVIMVFMGILLFVFSDLVMHLFTNDERVIEIGSRLLKIVAVNEPLFAAAIVLEGVFNGIGKTKTTLRISMMSLWIVRVAGTLLCLKVFNLGIYSAWICMIADNAVHCLLLACCYYKKVKR